MDEHIEMFSDEEIDLGIEEEMMDYLIYSDITKQKESTGCLPPILFMFLIKEIML